MSNNNKNQRQGEGHPSPAPAHVPEAAVFEGASPPPATPPNATSPEKSASPHIDPNIVYPGVPGEAIVPGVPHNPPSALPGDPHARTGGETNAPSDPMAEKQPSALLNNPKAVQTLGRQPASGGRRVMATAHIMRQGGKLSPGDEFELRDDEEIRLKGSFKEI